MKHQLQVLSALLVCGAALTASMPACADEPTAVLPWIAVNGSASTVETLGHTLEAALSKAGHSPVRANQGEPKFWRQMEAEVASGRPRANLAFHLAMGRSLGVNWIVGASVRWDKVRERYHPIGDNLDAFEGFNSEPVGLRARATVGLLVIDVKGGRVALDAVFDGVADASAARSDAEGMRKTKDIIERQAATMALKRALARWQAARSQ